jgi:hypothetical protein
MVCCYNIAPSFDVLVSIEGLITILDAYLWTRMLHSPTVSGRILLEFSESAGIQWNPVDSFGRECHSNLIPVTIFPDQNGQDDQYPTGMDGTHFQWIPVE